jgi:F0F1-type ATP synthase membrane subunit c/vacuolar-type H+-ATPase subunit K
MAMSQIRPELGRQDWSPIARGGQAFGQGVGQGLAQLGAGIGKAMDERKAMKAEVKATKLEQWAFLQSNWRT